MLFGLVLVIHVLVALFLITVILIQGGRGGMGETLSGAAAQSLFGGAANTVMTKITAVCAALFMMTCLSLAAISTARGRSVMDQLRRNSGQLPFTLPQEHEPSSTTETTPVGNSEVPGKPETSSEAPTSPLTPATPHPSTPSGSDESPDAHPAAPATP